MATPSLELSIISPVYRAEAIIPALVEGIRREAKKITPHYEIILVEDGSPDQSWAAISAESLKHPEIVGIKLSKNFGQHRAISAGMMHARGRWIVIMDCDLQDRPEEIPALYRKAQAGFEIVLAQRTERRDSLPKRAFSKIFYWFLSYLTGTKQDASVANFGIYSTRVIGELNRLSESFRFFPLYVRWLGFKTVLLPVRHQDRLSGKSSYNFRKLINLGVDVIIAFSDRPLKIVLKMGFFISMTALVFGIILLIEAAQGRFSVTGWPSIIVSIWFLGGFQIFTLGIIGLYLGKTFEETKRRPLYVVEEKLGG